MNEPETIMYDKDTGILTLTARCDNCKNVMVLRACPHCVAKLRKMIR